MEVVTNWKVLPLLLNWIAKKRWTRPAGSAKDSWNFEYFPYTDNELLKELLNKDLEIVLAKSCLWNWKRRNWDWVSHKSNWGHFTWNIWIYKKFFFPRYQSTKSHTKLQ